MQAESALPSLPAADRRLSKALAKQRDLDYILLDTRPSPAC